MVALTAPVPSGATPLTAVSHTFTPAERARLRRARSLRLLLVGRGTGAVGRFEVERINLEGSLFHGDANVSSVREIEEWAVPAGFAPPEILEEAFPEVSDIFHPYGETQKVLEATWAGGPWQAKSYAHAPTEGVDYRRIVYYYRLPQSPAGNIDFDLVDDTDKGIHWSIPAGLQTAWSMIEVSLDDGVVYRDGVPVVGATVTQDAGRGSLSLFKVSQASDQGAGRLYLDELHLTDPKSAVGAAAKGLLELELPGTLLAIGGHPVLHDLSLRQEASAGTKGFSSLYGIPQQESSLSSRTELSVGLSLLDLDADLQVAASGAEVSLAGGHRLAFPTSGSPVTFADAFSLRQGPAGLDLARSNRLSAVMGGLGSLGLEAEAISQEGLLTQTWSADLNLTPLGLDLRQRLELAETRSGYQVPEQDYFSNWVGAYTLLAPWEGGVEEERLSKADLVWSLMTRTVGVRLAGGYDTYSAEIQPTGRTQTSSLRLEASLPVTVRRREAVLFSLTPGYRRQVQLVERFSAPGDLGLDLSEGLAELAAQTYWFQEAPLDQLFSPPPPASSAR